MYIEEKLSDWLVENPTVLIRSSSPKDALEMLLNYVKGPVDFYTEEDDLKRLCDYLKLNVCNEDDAIWLQTGDTYELTEHIKASSQLWYFQVLKEKQRPNAKAIMYFDMTIDIRDGQIQGVAHRASEK